MNGKYSICFGGNANSEEKHKLKDEIISLVLKGKMIMPVSLVVNRYCYNYWWNNITWP